MKQIKLNKGAKYGLIAGGVVIFGLIAWRIVAKSKKTTIAPDGTPETQTKPVASTVAWPIGKRPGFETTPQEKEIVRNIQKYLNANGLLSPEWLDVDGIYGRLTEAAAQKVLGVKTISYKLYTNTILPKVG